MWHVVVDNTTIVATDFYIVALVATDVVVDVAASTTVVDRYIDR